jgi:hypothetical protein
MPLLVVDPTVAAFIQDGGMPAEMVWEVSWDPQ